jgi:hypothetical protein
MKMNGCGQDFLEARHKLIGVIGRDDAGHVLDAQRVGPMSSIFLALSR